ncbi:MAG: SMI1/KNR4 family protein [Sandaracinus sp.]|nr:SMI1/KNR4 family protein [Sandaracinus sp.]MCB9616178.1 SMI1/KNR4 family protein [Sandaracinus sp.]MCB9624082.1 SMI1/KNR4 family protein [Sandaracinus sp.]MCB9633558.1 SMI1/KNR4 family protein [Sandaracinus sp.]
MSFSKHYAELAAKHLSSPLAPSHGWPEATLAEAEARLGFRLPASVRAFYTTVGRHPELDLHPIVPPEELEVEERFLFFLHETQGVVSWGVKVEDVGRDDPEAWQRINMDPPEWHSEETTVSGLIQSMWEFFFPVEA